MRVRMAARLAAAGLAAGVLGGAAGARAGGEAPTDWTPMRLTSASDPAAGSEEVLAAWKSTRPRHFPNTGGSEPVLYQGYETPAGRAVVMIGYSPDCLVAPRPASGRTELSRCPARVVVTGTDGERRWLSAPACFQWNGQGAPGSANDPRTNANYTRYDPARNAVSLVSVAGGRIVDQCSGELALADAAAPASKGRQ